MSAFNRTMTAQEAVLGEVRRMFAEGRLLPERGSLYGRSVGAG